MTQAAYALDGKPCSAQTFYEVACDPRRHVVVQACAGAGKTWMLVSRILRALLAGAQAEEILAITFTKKAAGEMRERLQQWLHQFSLASDEALLQELVCRGVATQAALASKPDLRAALRQLYAQTLSAAKPVQIRTFHSWFGALLRGAPLAVLQGLGLPSPFELLESENEPVALVWPRFYALLQGDEALHAVYRAAVAQVGRASMETALEQGLAKRVEFALADAAGVLERSVQPLAQALPAFAGMDDPFALFAAHMDLMQNAARHLAQTHQPSFAQKGVELERALSAKNWPAVLPALLTQKYEPRKFSDKLHGIEFVRQAQEIAVQVMAAQAHQEAWQHHQNMTVLMRALNRCYAQLKRERGWVDMSDLEHSAMHLLQDEQVAGWMQQRLDAQIKHLLIDEFQDTNPLQWQSLQSWLSSYAGAGGGQGGAMPSVFIVGDAKQSIYRFRRAEPQVFEAAKDFVCQGLQGHLLSCDHTRRNAPQIIEVVNAVMAQAVSESAYPFRAHTTASEQGGSVLRLPLAPRPPKVDAAQGLHWRDTLTQAREQPQDRAVDAECTLAARWIAAQVGSGQAAQSFMVLARKRDRLSRMRDALRELGVPSQITEEVALMELPEVRDIVALLDALVSPSNDLALVQALKSPLFGWHDERLIALAKRQRAHPQQSWLELLCSAADGDQEPGGAPDACVQQVALDLRQCQRWLNQLPPHDALSAIYAQLDVLARFAQATPLPLRQRVQGSLQALLHASLQVQEGRFLLAHAWLRELKSPHRKAPKTLDAQAVRLMTIHGAKGLEADTVLLLDCHARAVPARRLDVLVDWPAQAAAPTVFAFLQSESRLPIGLAAAMAKEQGQREREEINALYVAMTRARQRLVISGHEPGSSHGKNSPWMRFEALGALVQDAWHGDFALPPVASQGAAQQEEWAMWVVPEGAGLGSPSAAQQIALMPAQPLDALAARIGSCMHRLLELYRPGLDLRALAQQLGMGFALAPQHAEQAAQAAQAIVQGPAAWAWDERVVDWQGDEVELLYQGQLLRIDRLVKRADTQTWWVLDYKSNPAPQQAPQLQAQLSQYRAAVQETNPQQAVKAAFITAAGEWIEL